MPLAASSSYSWLTSFSSSVPRISRPMSEMRCDRRACRSPSQFGDRLAEPAEGLEGLSTPRGGARGIPGLDAKRLRVLAEPLLAYLIVSSGLRRPSGWLSDGFGNRSPNVSGKNRRWLSPVTARNHDSDRLVRAVILTILFHQCSHFMIGVPLLGGHKSTACAKYDANCK